MDTPGTLSSSRLEIHLLGQFAVFVDGTVLPESAVKGREARSLLKLIACQRNFQMDRDLRQSDKILLVAGDSEAQNLRCNVLERTGDAYRACGQLDKSYEAYESAISLAEKAALNSQKRAEL